LVTDPPKRATMSPVELAAAQAKADSLMRQNWRVMEGALVYQGKGFDNLCTAEDHGDFELLLDWKINEGGDSGIYLRGSPQVQIWDSTEKDKYALGADKGSGGLWNNSPGAPGKTLSSPLVVHFQLRPDPLAR